MKVVINNTYGGFGLSHKAEYTYLCEKYGKDNVFCYFCDDDECERRNIEEYLNDSHYCSNYFLSYEYLGESFNEKEYRDQNPDKKIPFFWQHDESLEYRSDPILVKIVKEMGKESWGKFAKLKIVNVPEDAKVYINDYDGIESVVEVHRTWG